PSPLLNEPSGFISPVCRFGALRAPTVIPSFYSASLHSRTATRIYFILEGLLPPARAARAGGKEPRRFIKQRLRLFVCMRFQDLLHSPSGVLFAFPSRYWFTIGRSRVFSLGGWSPHLQAGFHVSRPTFRTLSSTPNLSRTGLSPTLAALSRAFR